MKKIILCTTILLLFPLLACGNINQGASINEIENSKIESSETSESVEVDTQAENSVQTESPTDNPIAETDEKSEEEIAQIIDDAFAGFTIIPDDFSGDKLYMSNKDDFKIATYTAPGIHYRIRNPLSIRCIRKGNECQFYVEMVYNGEDWLFFDKAQIKAGQDIYEIDLSGLGTDHDIASGRPVETYRPILKEDTDLMKAIRAVVDNQAGSIRYIGTEGVFTYDFDADNIDGISEMLRAYDAINQSLNN